MFSVRLGKQTEKEQQINTLLVQVYCADKVQINGTSQEFVMRSVNDWKTWEIEDFRRKPELEDHHIIFETPTHSFNWWEIREESEKVSENAWRIAGVNVTFEITT